MVYSYHRVEIVTYFNHITAFKEQYCWPSVKGGLNQALQKHLYKHVQSAYEPCSLLKFNTMALWRMNVVEICDGIIKFLCGTATFGSAQTKVKVVAVHQELGEIEELWNKLFHISHVGFTGWSPCIWDTVKQPIRQVKMAALCVLWCVCKCVRGRE